MDKGASPIGEEWRPVPGYAGLYEVSALGAVRSLYFTPPRPVKAWSNRDGYWIIAMNKGGRRTTFVLHRLVCRAFHGEGEPPRNEVAHLDGNRTNARADNLQWVSRLENVAHKRLHGTHQAGDLAGHRILNSQQVASIRHAKGIYSSAQLSSQYRVSRHAIYDIWQGKRWRAGPKDDAQSQDFSA